jgi:protein TonB
VGNPDSADGVIEENVFTFVEEMPQFPGGDGEIYKFIAANIKYPQSAKEIGLQGKVFLSFIIKKTGEISHAQILRGIQAPKDTVEAQMILSRKAAVEMNEEALRVVRSMPPWKPGKQNGKPVDVKFVLPLKFTLE